MLVLVCGLAVFLGVHTWPMVPSIRVALANRLGQAGYMILFSVMSFAGLAMIVWGYGQARALGGAANPNLWLPPDWTRHVTHLLMLPAIILMVAAYVPSRIRDRAKHPMLASIKLWAGAHLLVRGDLASVLLFGSFLAWAVADRISVKQRGALGPLGARTGSARGDAIVLVVGVTIYAVFFVWLHYALFGVPLLRISFAP